jgi:hypothetical protein
LIKLLSLAFTEGFYHASRIDREILEATAKALILDAAHAPKNRKNGVINHRTNTITLVARGASFG